MAFDCCIVFFFLMKLLIDCFTCLFFFEKEKKVYKSYLISWKRKRSSLDLMGVCFIMRSLGFQSKLPISNLPHNLRSSGKTQQIFTRLTSSENSIQIIGEKLWNEIPDSTKLFTTFTVFKRDIKTGLIENMA